MSGRFRGIAAAIISVFFGSTYSIFSKYLLQFTLPETLILLSQLFSVLTVLFLFGLLPGVKDIFKLNKRLLGMLGLVALFAGVVNPLLFMKGLMETTAINAIVVSRLSAIFMGIIGFVWLHERFTWRWLVGTSCMLLGIIIIATEGFSIGMHMDAGIAWVAGSALVSAIGSILYKKYLSSIKTEVVIFIRYAVGFLVYMFVVPVLMSMHHNISIGFEYDVWYIFAGMALIPIVGALYLWYEALDHLPASLVGAINLLTPLSGMVLAYVFLHEQLYRYHLRGTILLLAGLVINLIKNIHTMSPRNIKRMLYMVRSR